MGRHKDTEATEATEDTEDTESTEGNECRLIRMGTSYGAENNYGDVPGISADSPSDCWAEREA